MSGYLTHDEPKRAVLVGAITEKMDMQTSTIYLDELEFLSTTAGAITLCRFTQRLQQPIPATYIGKGKMNEVHAYIISNEIDLVIFDDELSPTQQFNLEKLFQVQVLDRVGLILDIFAQRAQTAYARVQVELAQYEYLLPRLRGMWTHLERQQGGIGMRGPGETEIETDRRIARNKIAKLKGELLKIDRQKQTQRKSRGKLVRVALVGYTNVGKSTMMNRLSKSKVLAENKLFATLDTTVRKCVIHNLPFLLADTVGFIRKLPHQLVESFKSTLDETREADILVHMVDISHSNFREQIRVVNQTLNEIGSSGKRMIYLFNKIDAFTYLPKAEDDISPSLPHNNSLEDWERLWKEQVEEPTVFISAKKRLLIDAFREVLYQEVKKIHITRFPYNDFLF